MPWHSMAFSLFALSSSGGGAVCSNQLGVTSPILVETTDGQRRSLSTQMIRKKKSKRKEKGKVAAWHSTNNEHIRARKPERLEKGLSQTFSREAERTDVVFAHSIFLFKGRLLGRLWRRTCTGVSFINYYGCSTSGKRISHSFFSNG